MVLIVGSCYFNLVWRLGWEFMKNLIQIIGGNLRWISIRLPGGGGHGNDSEGLSMVIWSPGPRLQQGRLAAGPPGSRPGGQRGSCLLPVMQEVQGPGETLAPAKKGSPTGFTHMHSPVF